MKEDRQVAKNYAQALFELAKDDLALQDLFLNEIKLISESIFKNNFSDFFKNPGISKKEKNELIKKLFENKINQKVLNFLFLLIEKQRFSLLPHIQDYLIKLTNKAKGIVVAYVSSAQELDSIALDKIKQKLESSLGTNEKVTIESKLEPELIGGVKIKINDLIYDGSIKERLGNLKKRLG